MKCKKCSHELKEGNLFCPECGTKTDEKDQEEVFKIPNTIPVTKEKKGKKKLVIMISASILAILIVFVGIFYFASRPKDVNLEAAELVELLNSGTSDKYNGDNLYVHGYLLRSQGETSSYVLAPSLDDIEDLKMENFLYFVYDEELDEDLGTNSEITVKGKLAEKISDKNTVFHGTSISIQNKVKPLEVTSKTCTSYQDGMMMEATYTAENDKITYVLAEITLDSTGSGVYLDMMTWDEKQEIKNEFLKEMGIKDDDNVEVEFYGNSIVFTFYIDLKEGDESLLNALGFKLGEEYTLSDTIKNMQKNGGTCK